MLFTTPENVDYWDEQLAKVMFRYICKIHANIKFFPFMIMTGHTPHLRADNYLHSLTTMIDDIVDAKIVVAQFFQNMKLIANIHENVLFNVEQTQKKQNWTYVTRKRKSSITLKR